MQKMQKYKIQNRNRYLKNKENTASKAWHLRNQKQRVFFLKILNIIHFMIIQFNMHVYLYA